MKRLFSIPSDSFPARIAGYACGVMGGTPLAVLLTTLFMASGVCSVSAQMDLNNVVFHAPTAQDPTLRADFFLQDINLGAAGDSVLPPVKVTANGTPVDPTSVTFTKTADLPNYSCAVLLLVDNTLGNRQGIDQKTKDQLRAVVTRSLLKFTSAAGTPPYNLEIATIYNGGIKVLATMGSTDQVLKEAINGIKFDSDVPQLYLELKEAVKMFSQISADRKFMVVYSDGFSNDQEKVASATDVISAAQKAQIHICPIAFPETAGTTLAQGLEPLAEQTGGTWVQATTQVLSGSSPQVSPSTHQRQAPAPEHARFELPKDAEDGLLKLLASGGQVQLKVSGLTVPAELTFTIQTQLKRLYTFNYKLDSIPAAPSSSASPSATASPGATPSVGLSLVDQVKSWLIGHPLLSSLIAIAGLGLIVILFFLVILIRFSRRNAQDQSPLPDDITLPVGPFPDPEPAPLAWLESLDGEQTRYPITKSAVRIGRKPDNDIVMKNDTVSGHHAEILARGSEFVIADLGSSNQILVGGKQVQRSLLQDGDVIELGEVRLRFLFPQAANPTLQDSRTKMIS